MILNLTKAKKTKKNDKIKQKMIILKKIQKKR